MSHRQLTSRLEELTEEHSLQSLTPHPSSLLCEIEQSMEQEEQEQEREQVVTAGLGLIVKTTKIPVKILCCAFLTTLPPAGLFSCVISYGRPTARFDRSAPISGETTSRTRRCPLTLPWTSPRRRPQPRMCLLGASTPAC